MYYKKILVSANMAMYLKNYIFLKKGFEIKMSHTSRGGRKITIWIPNLRENIPKFISVSLMVKEKVTDSF